MKYQAGTALTEYTLIGILILSCCIAASLNIGVNLKGLIHGLQADMTAHSKKAFLVNQNMASQSSSVISSELPSSSPLKLSEDERVLLKKPLADKIQTTGANGTTKLLAKHLEALAEQLLAQGKITEAQNESILRLANQGHYIAEIERLIEQAITSQQSTVMFEGKTYELRAIASQIAFTNRGPLHFAEGDILSEYTAYQQPEMTKFVALYQDVMSSGIASDPLVATTIQSAATQIANIAESLEDSVFRPSEMALKNDLASRVTQMNSTKICQAGGFRDNSLLCSL